MSAQLKYVSWNDTALGGFDDKEWDCLLTEIDEKGFVRREVALDKNGKPLRIFPNPDDPDYRGFFDLAKIEVENLSNDISAFEFDELFNKGLLE